MASDEVFQGLVRCGIPEADAADQAGDDITAFSPATTDRFITAAETVPMVACTITAGQDINDNGAVAWTQDRADAGWAVAGTSVTFTGSPDRVRIAVQVHQGAAVARANPTLELRRGGAIVATSSSGYIRNATGHTESSNSIAWTDPTPGTNPVYTVTSRQESTAGGVVPVIIGSFSAEAVG